MPALLERPRFFEGQILGAGDLDTLLQYGRAQDARDRRTLRTWGIADGLTLSLGTDEVTVATGMAIDSSGLQIVVPETATIDVGDLPPQSFTTQTGPTKTPTEPPFLHFPVFLVARQTDAASDELIGRCASTQAVRVEESYLIQVGRPHEKNNWDAQTAPSIGSGPDDAAVSSRRVLLGFIRHNGKQFDKPVLEYDGVRPRYVGVRGDDFESVSGRITLRTAPPGSADKPIVVIDRDSETQTLALGTDDGNGALKDAVFSVDKQGNVTAKGTISVAVDIGKVLVQSGSASDGVKVPLPPGLTEQQVKETNVSVHVMLTPRLFPTLAPGGGSGGPWIGTPLICSVDSERRVQCVIRWVDLTDVTNPVDRSGVCDYLVIISVPPSGSAS